MRKKIRIVRGRNKAENKYVNDKEQEDKRKNGLTDGGRKIGRDNLNSDSHRTWVFLHVVRVVKF